MGPPKLSSLDRKQQISVRGLAEVRARAVLTLPAVLWIQIFIKFLSPDPDPEFWPNLDQDLDPRVMLSFYSCCQENIGTSRDF